MAFNPFKRDYNKPGPGVPKNAPKKKGLPRFWEVLSRDFGNLVKLNLLMVLCMLPAIILGPLAGVGLSSGALGFALLFGVLFFLSGALVGPAMAAACYVIIKMLRDQPGFLLNDFKKAYKENFKHMMLPGMLFTSLIGAEIFCFFTIGQASIPLVAIFFFSFLLLILITPYYFSQAAYIDLKPLPMLQNSIALSIGYLPRSFAGGIIGAALLVAQLLFFPVTLIITAIIGITLPLLITLMWVWPMMDKTFNIDKALKERHDQQFDIETEISES